MALRDLSTSGVNLAVAALASAALVWLVWVADMAAPLTILSLGAVMFLMAASAEFRARRAGGQRQKLFRWYFSLGPLLLLIFYAQNIVTFGYFDWSSIFLHADGGLLTPGVVWQYVLHSGHLALAAVVLIAGLGFLTARGLMSRAVDLVLVAFTLTINPAVAGPIKYAVYTDPLAAFLEPYYTDVSGLSAATPAPEAAKNVLHIFLESAERTYFNDEFGDVMQPLADFESRGFTATNMIEIAHTQNSISGIVAANCGTPLLIPPMMTRWQLETTEEFLPGATCLGDILGARGYEMSIVSGWPLEFTGQGSFFKNHGFTGLYGAAEVKAAVPGDGTSFGADDGQVVDMAYQLLRDAKSHDKPFLIAVAVSGGHAADGFLASRCAGKTGLDKNQPNILHAVKCTNMLVADMLHKAEAQGLLENTVIVLQSDHLSHPSTVTDRLKKFERRNFFAISGPGIAPQQNKALASMLDAMPTILQAVDIDLPHGKAGIGTSLLANRMTLVEELDLPLFDRALMADSALRTKLWATDQRATAAVR